MDESKPRRNTQNKGVSKSKRLVELQDSSRFGVVLPPFLESNQIKQMSDSELELDVSVTDESCSIDDELGLGSDDVRVVSLFDE